MASEVAFRQLFCGATGCGAMFFICSPCYRGQRYCGDECRRNSRREQRQKANRRYRQDPEVRQDHRERMRLFRQHRRQRVIDQSSIDGCGSGSIGEPLATETKAPAVEEAEDALEPHRRSPFIGVVCRLCGRIGRFIAARIRRE